MHKDKIICGHTTGQGLKELNMVIEDENSKGYRVIDMSSPNPEEICILLCNKTDKV